ncbi:MAG TPA: hypothetical protein DEP72_07835 [Clostridiales bacterium]|nr:hypothetical protein [Clostridiales bacterium]
MRKNLKNIKTFIITLVLMCTVLSFAGIAYAATPTRSPAPQISDQHEITSTLSWMAVSGATSYKVYSSDTIDDDGSYRQWGNDTTSTSMELNLAPYKIYYFRVSSVDNSGQESQLSYARFVKPSFFDPPVVDYLDSPHLTNSINLHMPLSYNATSSVIYARDESLPHVTDDEFPNDSKTLKWETGNDDFTITGLNPGTEYTIKVYSKRLGILSSGCDERSYRTRPSAPTNFSIEYNGTASYTLRWTGTPDADKYKITANYYKTSKHDTGVNTKTYDIPKGTTSQKIIITKPDEFFTLTHSYDLVAYTDESGLWSEEVNLTELPPASPLTGLSVEFQKSDNPLGLGTKIGDLITKATYENGITKEVQATSYVSSNTSAIIISGTQVRSTDIAGEADIKATYIEDGRTEEASCHVSTIPEHPYEAAVHDMKILCTQSTQIGFNKIIGTLTTLVNYEGVTYDTYVEVKPDSYTSSDTNVATISGNIVTSGTKVGTSVITAKYKKYSTHYGRTIEYSTTYTVTVLKELTPGEQLSKPGTPVSHNITGTSLLEATFSWDLVSNAASYKVYSCDTEYGTYTLVGETISSEIKLRLVPGKRVFLKVSGVNDWGEGDKSTARGTTPPFEKPTVGFGIAPYMLHLYPILPDTIDLNINLPENIEKGEVFAYDRCDMTVVAYSGVATGSGRYTITGLTPGHNYYIKVCSIYEDTLTGETLRSSYYGVSQETRPSTPQNVTVSYDGAKTVTVSWTASPERVDTYRVVADSGNWGQLNVVNPGKRYDSGASNLWITASTNTSMTFEILDYSKYIVRPCTFSVQAYSAETNSYSDGSIASAIPTAYQDSTIVAVELQLVFRPDIKLGSSNDMILQEKFFTSNVSCFPNMLNVISSRSMGGHFNAGLDFVNTATPVVAAKNYDFNSEPIKWNYDNNSVLTNGATIGSYVTADPTSSAIAYTRVKFFYDNGARVFDLYRTSVADKSPDYIAEQAKGGLYDPDFINVGTCNGYILSATNFAPYLNEFTSMGIGPKSWDNLSGEKYAKVGKTQVRTEFVKTGNKLNIYNIVNDGTRNVLIDTSNGSARIKENIPLTTGSSTFSLLWNEQKYTNANTNTIYNGNPPLGAGYTYVGYKIIYTNGINSLYNGTSVSNLFDGVSTSAGNASGDIVSPNKTANVCFIWKQNAGGTVTVRHINASTGAVFGSTVVPITNMPSTTNIAYNSSAYGYSSVNFEGCTNVGYAFTKTPTYTQPAMGQTASANYTVPVSFVANDTNKYGWVNFYWNVAPVSGINANILYNPPNSDNLIRKDWTNNNHAVVYYENTAAKYRTDPVGRLSGDLYAINPFASRSQGPETNGTYQKDVTMYYTWSWTESFSRLVTARYPDVVTQLPDVIVQLPDIITQLPDSITQLPDTYVRNKYGRIISVIPGKIIRTPGEIIRTPGGTETRPGGTKTTPGETYTYTVYWTEPRSSQASAVWRYSGYWDLYNEVVSNNALKSTPYIRHYDTVYFKEGKNIYLDAVPGAWDSHAQWVSQPSVSQQPTLPANGYGLYGSWSSSTDANAYFRSDFPSPSQPPWNGVINPGRYSIDYTQPTVAIKADIGTTSSPSKLSAIQQNKWYGGPGYEQITTTATVSDMNKSVYNVTGDKSGVWYANMTDTTNAYSENLTLGGIAETKPVLIDHKDADNQDTANTEGMNTTSQATGVHTALLNVEDFATNTNQLINTYLLDNMKPTITYSGAGEGTETWFNVPISIIVNFRDKDSGLDKLSYRLENEARDTTTSEYINTNEVVKNINNNKAGQGSVSKNEELKEIKATIIIGEVGETVHPDGEYYLYIDNVVDPVGNEFGSVQKGPYKYDATRPSIDINFSGRVTNTTRVEYIADRTNKIDIKVWDNLSGIDKVEYALINSNVDKTSDPENEGITGWQSLHTYNGIGNKYISIDGSNSYLATIKLDESSVNWKNMKSGWYYLHIRVTDRAGNVTLLTGDNTTDITNTHIEVRRPNVPRYNAIRIFINKVVPEGVDGFKLADVADPKWKGTLEGNKYIPTREMPAYNNQIPSKIKLGYRTYYELDTVGYGHLKNDHIHVTSRYFVNTPKGYKEVYIYLPTDKYSNAYGKQTNWSKDIVRQTGYTGGNIDEPGVIKTIDFAGEKYRWFFEFYIRPDAKFVLKDSLNYGLVSNSIDLSRNDQTKFFVDTVTSPNLLVLFQIDADKYTGYAGGFDTHLDYTLQDNTWGGKNGVLNPTNSTSYGNMNPTGKNLIMDYNENGEVGEEDQNGDADHGPDHGEAFWYDLQNTLIDDLQSGSGWSGN